MTGSPISVSLARSINGFATRLHRVLATRPGNLACSPSSIASALAMTWAGARGDTEAQIRAVLGLADDRETTLAGYRALTRALGAPGSAVTLHVANQLFVSDGFATEPAFERAMVDVFGAGLARVDFAAGEPTRERINDWVARQTEQRICDLIPRGMLLPTTRLALIDAIYFLARWDEPFLTSATYDEPFTTAPGQHRDVPTMHATGTWRLAACDGVRVLELPYVEHRAAMLIVLPDAPDGLAELEAGLTASDLERWRDALSPTTVEVALPRFTVDPAEVLALSAALGELGMPAAFDAARADFSGITETPPGLHLDEVLHKAFIKVDEQGTEAAAAAAILMVERGAPRRAVELRVDRPFLFAIVDEASGLILFLGRIVDPAAG